MKDLSTLGTRAGVLDLCVEYAVHSRIPIFPMCVQVQQHDVCMSSHVYGVLALSTLVCRVVYLHRGMVVDVITYDADVTAVVVSERALAAVEFINQS